MIDGTIIANLNQLSWLIHIHGLKTMPENHVVFIWVIFQIAKQISGSCLFGSNFKFPN